MSRITKFLKEVFKPRSEKGSFMIEAIVSLTLITVGMLGVFSLVTNSIKANRTVGNRFTAANLAGEGIEIVKNMIDSDVADPNRSWNDTVYSGSSFRVDYKTDNLMNFPPIALARVPCYKYVCVDEDGNFVHERNETPTIFKRIVSVDDDSGNDRIEVVSRVEWEESGEMRIIEVEDEFYNWREDN